MFRFWKKKPAEPAKQAADEVQVESAAAEHVLLAPDAVEPAAHVRAATESVANAPVAALDAQVAADAVPASDEHTPAVAAENAEEAPVVAPLEHAPSVIAAGTRQPLTANAERTPAASMSAQPPVPAANLESAPPATAAAPTKLSWRERLSGSGLARSFASLFSRNPKLDEDLLDEIETSLLTADVGVSATESLVSGLRQRMQRREFSDARALMDALRGELRALLQPVAKPLSIDGAKPFVILTVGINGVGKTTSIGKLAYRFKAQGRQVLLAAGDTFRAAAVEQLKAWGERNQVGVIAQGSGADSASVIYDALAAAQSRGVDLLIADTAGRLHTQSGLMDELSKIRRVLSKLDPNAPHEVLMVIDGTTGQNAVNQVRQFRASAGVTGLVVTKLDGSAKGGVVFALAREFGLPIRFVGLGEKAEDLREFEPAAFVDALLPESLGA
jgi:fused signal recognition particle receptor